MKKYCFLTSNDECGKFKNDKNEEIVYNRTISIFNELQIADNGDVISARIRNFKTSRDFDPRTLKPGNRYATLYFDQFGRLCGAKE